MKDDLGPLPDVTEIGEGWRERIVRFAKEIIGRLQYEIDHPGPTRREFTSGLLQGKIDGIKELRHFLWVDLDRTA